MMLLIGSATWAVIMIKTGATAIALPYAKPILGHAESFRKTQGDWENMMRVE